MEMSEQRKAELRALIRERKRKMRPDEKREWDRAIGKRLLELPAIARADCVYAYVPLATEAGAWQFLEALVKDGKRLALPRVEGRSMRFYYVTGRAELKEGVFRIQEPAFGCPEANEQTAVMLTPGTAFTETGKRLGKGGGYYDRFLEAEPDHIAIGMAYEFQMVSEAELEEGPLDRRVDMIVTPDRFIVCGEHA